MRHRCAPGRRGPHLLISAATGPLIDPSVAPDTRVRTHAAPARTHPFPVSHARTHAHTHACTYIHVHLSAHVTFSLSPSVGLNLALDLCSPTPLQVEVPPPPPSQAVGAGVLVLCAGSSSTKSVTCAGSCRAPRIPGPSPCIMQAR